jgi:hypothetical protein
MGGFPVSDCGFKNKEATGKIHALVLFVFLLTPGT